jgi:hypothetical protein
MIVKAELMTLIDSLLVTDDCKHEYGNIVLQSIPQQRQCIKCGELQALVTDEKV